MPVGDFFESLDLSRSSDLTEAVERFIHEMETDTFRTWESVIREEQDLPTMPVLLDLAAELLNFNDPDLDDPVHYIDEIPRCSEPWYEILRRIAPHLVIERIRTADVHEDVLVTGWPRIATCIERRAQGIVASGGSPPAAGRRARGTPPSALASVLLQSVVRIGPGNGVDAR